MNILSGLRNPALLLLALAGMASSVLVQAQEMTLAPSPALSCLARKDGKADKLDYPQLALERKDGGLVKVDMTFNAPDRAPHVKVESDATGSALEEAVSDYVDGYRLPCLDPKAAPVTLHREYLFVPNDGRKVVSTNFRDVDDARRAAQMACVKNIAGKTKPDYPRSARRDEAQGKFYVEMTFSAPDQPPQLKWLVAGKKQVLRWALEEYAKDLRMPCQSGQPVQYRVLFQFAIIDGERTIMRDISLKQYIGAAKEIPTSVYFDLNSMACPFDLRVRYMQPFGQNIISELDSSNPARKPFIDWLSNITLNFTDDQLSKIYGESFTVSVPCGKVDL